MLFFTGTEFNDTYLQMLRKVTEADVEAQPSRVGPVKDLGVATLDLPADGSRLITLRQRALNPFFALAESSVLLAGSRDVRPLRYFIEDYDKFSDDGVTINGAYGFRLRSYFGVDQIAAAISVLQRDPASRRVVLEIWAVEDLTKDSKDIPCHTQIFLKVRDGMLELTVINRSNDLFLGVPYDVLLFAILHRHIADEVGVGIGTQRHFIDSLHLYVEHEAAAQEILTAHTGDGSDTSLGFSRFDLSEYARIDHKRVAELDFEALDDQKFRDFFLSFKTYKEDRDFRTAVDLLPLNDLGYCGFLWYLKKKDFPAEIRSRFR